MWVGYYFSVWVAFPLHSKTISRDVIDFLPSGLFLPFNTMKKK